MRPSAYWRQSLGLQQSNRGLCGTQDDTSRVVVKVLKKCKHYAAMPSQDAPCSRSI